MLGLALAGPIALSACGDYDGEAAGAGNEIGTTQQAVSTKCGAPSNGPVQGVDVSYYQGDFNWAAQKAAGLAFGYARVSDGTGFSDPKFSQNWQGMKAAGILRGAYQFFEPGQDATAQANLVVSAVGHLGDGDLPCMIDVESTGGQSSATIVAKMKTWLQVVEQGTGKRPVIYTGPYFWQDNVGSGAFSSYPLWIAHYGVSCPLIPDNWSDWTIWQYSDGSGTLDHDVFNGTLAELKALGVINQAPRGNLDTAACTGITGWAQDPDEATKSIAVHVYFDGKAGASGAVGVALTADVDRQDLCTAIGSCNHGFSLLPPRGFCDDQAHDVYAYGIDTAGGANTLLTGSPKSFSCPPPEAPLTPAQGVKRWVTDPAIFSAWKFSYRDDVAHYPDSVVDGYPDGPDWPAAPQVVQADDGTPEVWVIDGTVRRHVLNPQAMKAWRFDAPQSMPAAELYGYPAAVDFRPEPFLMMGSGAKVYVLDSPWSAKEPPPAGSDDGGTADAAVSDGWPIGEAGADGDAGSAAAVSGATIEGDSASGCACTASRSADRAPRWALVIGALAVAQVRRRRRAPGPTRAGGSRG